MILLSSEQPHDGLCEMFLLTGRNWITDICNTFPDWAIELWNWMKSNRQEKSESSDRSCWLAKIKISSCIPCRENLVRTHLVKSERSVLTEIRLNLCFFPLVSGHDLDFHHWLCFIYFLSLSYTWLSGVTSSWLTGTQSNPPQIQKSEEHSSVWQRWETLDETMEKRSLRLIIHSALKISQRCG